MNPGNKSSIAIVDGYGPHREEVCKALLSFYDASAYDDGKTALKSLTVNPPALILVGEQVSPGGGLNFIKALRQERSLNQVPIIYIVDHDSYQAMADSKAAGAEGYIAKPYRRSALIKTISKQLNASIEHEWEALPVIQKQALQGSVDVFNNLADSLSTGEPLPFDSVKGACGPLVEAIGNNDFKSILNGVKNHDDYTYAHSMRVATMLSLLGHAAGFKKDEQLLLASGGLLHDVGKMMIPHSVLNKPGRLTEEEFEVMKSHVPETIKYLKDSGDIPKAIFIIAEQHHEKLNGMGYPNGLKGSQLNQLARMAAVVDVFSALTDRRVYKAPMEAEKAIAIMEDEMTDHLDQRLVKMFKGMLGDADILNETD